MEASPKHKNDILASQLLLAGLVVVYLLLIVRWILGIAPIRPTPWPYLIPVSTVLSFALMAAPYYAVRFGKQWSRILVFAVVAGTLWLNFIHRENIAGDPLNVLSWVVYAVTHLWGLMLLFWRPRRPPVDEKHHRPI
jgi:hypothetical protein